MTWLVLLLLLAPARADMPLPSYRDAVGEQAWHEVNVLVESGRYRQAIERAREFQSVVAETAGLEYLVGLSYIFLDEPRQAEIHLQRSIALDATYPAPWSDLGEIYLSQGRYDEARACFEQVAALHSTGPGSATGPRRLAEVAAHQHRPEAFERHLREALRRGFSFRDVAGLPNWQKFYADPVMHDSVVKMITVYGTREVLKTLAPSHTAERTPAPAPVPEP